MSTDLVLKHFTVMGRPVITMYIDWDENLGDQRSKAVVEVVVDGIGYHGEAKGTHPLLAFGRALQKALMLKFPFLAPEKFDVGGGLFFMHSFKQVAELVNLAVGYGITHPDFESFLDSLFK